MSLKPSQKIKMFISKLVFSMAFVLGIVATLSVTSSPENLEDEATVPMASSRGIASLPSIEEKPVFKLGSLSLKCGVQRYTTVGNYQIRLRGTPCGSESKFKLTHSQIKNESLGIDATVFISTADKKIFSSAPLLAQNSTSNTAKSKNEFSSEFTTDYIKVAPGENIFTMKSTFEDGAVIEKTFYVIAK